jgi:hypothetical protein
MQGITDISNRSPVSPYDESSRELARAPGTDAVLPSLSQDICFLPSAEDSMSSAIRARILHHDTTKGYWQQEMAQNQYEESMESLSASVRPTTAELPGLGLPDHGISMSPNDEPVHPIGPLTPIREEDGVLTPPRPHLTHMSDEFLARVSVHGNTANFTMMISSDPVSVTDANPRPSLSSPSSKSGSTVQTILWEQEGSESVQVRPFYNAEDVYHCRNILIEVMSTWGDETYLGLTGLALIPIPGHPSIKLEPHNVITDPADLSSLGLFDDPRVSANLINGVNNTTNGILF